MKDLSDKIELGATQKLHLTLQIKGIILRIVSHIEKQRICRD